MIRGVKNGSTTITATHRLSGIERSCTVQVSTGIGNGYFFIKNLSTGEYLSQTDSSTGIKANGECGERMRVVWNVSSVGNGYYVIQSAYLGKYLRPVVRMVNSAVTVTNSITDEAHWRITRTDSGSYKIVNFSTSTFNKNLALTAVSASSTQITLYSSSSSYNAKCEWELIPVVYGAQMYYEYTEDNNQKNNCHSYAMMLDEADHTWEQPLGSLPYDYNGSIPSTMSYSYALTSYAQTVKTCFEDWLNENEIVYEEELDFLNNQTAPLAYNQYRVILRMGMFNMGTDENRDYLIDFHFWFQTRNGQWTHKSGSEQEPELLAEGITPDTDPRVTPHNGWTNYNHVQPIGFFYTSDIYCYIITVE